MSTKSASEFNFDIEDIESWTVRYKDGTTSRFCFGEPITGVKRSSSGSYSSTGSGGSTYYSCSKWCSHTPHVDKDGALEKGGFVFEGFNKKGVAIRVFIGDYQGTRDKWKDFDFVLDAGDVLSAYEARRGNVTPSELLVGDSELVQNLTPLVTPDKVASYFDESIKTRILKIKWTDRAAPSVTPQFWPELLERLSGNVLVNCVGGHGRSGSMLTILMMLMSDYTPCEAILHLRAIHCPRAIESKAQHEYLNSIGKFLGREADIEQAIGLSSYRVAFLSMDSSTAKPYQQKLLKVAGQLPAEVPRDEVEVKIL